MSDNSPTDFSDPKQLIVRLQSVLTEIEDYQIKILALTAEANYLTYELHQAREDELRLALTRRLKKIPE